MQIVITMAFFYLLGFFKNIVCVFQQLLFPISDLVRMNIKSLRSFCQRLLTFYRFNRDFGLEYR